MKRKFKLLTSVASLCVAVALMAFGVYAAATPEVKLSGTVSFTANNVIADVIVKVDGAEHQKVELIATSPEVNNVNEITISLNESKLTSEITIYVTSKQADPINVEVTDNSAGDAVKLLTYNKVVGATTVDAGASEILVHTGTFTANLGTTKTGAAGSVDITVALSK